MIGVCCAVSSRPLFTCAVAHEFFDALPVHQFQFTGKGCVPPRRCDASFPGSWRERLVDVAGKDSPHPLRCGAHCNWDAADERLQIRAVACCDGGAAGQHSAAPPNASSPQVAHRLGLLPPTAPLNGCLEVCRSRCMHLCMLLTVRR